MTNYGLAVLKQLNRLRKSIGRTRKSTSSQRQLRFELCEDRRMLATFVVNSNQDNTVADSFTTLREAIVAANLLPDPDTIDLSGVTGTINLTQGQMFVTESVTITGPGRDVLTIEAGDDSRIFNIDDATQPLALV